MQQLTLVKLKVVPFGHFFILSNGTFQKIINLLKSSIN
jgi:hypothetical protein